MAVFPLFGTCWVLSNFCGQKAQTIRSIQEGQMFQSFKRAGFLAKNNFQHWQAGSGVQLHLWLQKNGWPANEFVDLFMRCHLNFDPDFDSLSFKLFMEDQFDWVSTQDVEALDRLAKTIDTPQYRGVDKDHLLDFVTRMQK